MKNYKKAFTIIEVMISILIISSCLIVGFQLYSMALVSKVKIVEQTNLEKNIFYFSEKLFTLIKKGGTLDYEEYFNRKIIGTEIESGHFSKNTGFGNFGYEGVVGTSNFGKGFYYCLSGDGEDNKLKPTGCWEKLNIDSNIVKEGKKDRNYFGSPQRYGQYSFQFIDYNSNHDDDSGDENGDGKIIRDDDDEHKGSGPEVFDAGSDVKELYLLSGDKKKRTLIRWKYFQDEFITDSSKKCSDNPDDKQYCRGTIEFLELEGKDWGLDHNSAVNDDFQNDGVVDTWIISKEFTGGEEIIAGGEQDGGKYRKELFSDDINISDFKISAYPNIDNTKTWNVDLKEQKSYLVSPYVTISMQLKPSWKLKAKIQGNIKDVNFNSTINLTDIFSN
ncbi:prepilin-type N-terminal cleavage/methylation domain-containing protein [Candidatus Gracilibacteria bacterium]|nr:prepilin-type N-terminal cleavage/methylation domain-containing protein [Candidatus Gracilibacteria bacterium]